MKPSVGRIVHYVDAGGRHLAAVISEMIGDATSLNCFWPLGRMRGNDVGSIALGIVAYSGEPKSGTWHWPERE